MTYNANYPVSADVLANPSNLTNRDDPGFELHGVISRIQDILEALEAKVGIGSSTPPASGAILRRTATGASGWGALQNGDIGAGQVVSDKLNAGGTANRVLATTDGANTAWAQATTAMIAAGAVTTVGAVGLSPTSTTSTSMAAMTGGGMTITTQGGQTFFLLTLYGMSNDAGTVQGSVELWEGGASLGTLLLNDNSTQRSTRSAHILLSPSAAAHTYALVWSTVSGTMRHIGGLFSAFELKR